MRQIYFLVGFLFVNSVPIASVAHAAISNPVITSPSQSAQIGNRLSVRWKGVKGAKSYRICIRAQGHSGCAISKTTRRSSVSYGTNRAPVNALRGRLTTIHIKACEQGNGTVCNSRWSRVSVYIKGVPVNMRSPAMNATYSQSDRRPTFSWDEYTGIGGNGMRYTLTVSGQGAPQQKYTGITSTSFRPPANNPIKSEFNNPVMWSVVATDGRNSSARGIARKLNLAGSPVNTVTAPQLLTPSSQVLDTGSELRWRSVANAANYKVCLSRSTSGCNIIRAVPPGSGSIRRYTLTNNDLSMFRGQTVKWRIQALTAGNTAYADSNSRTNPVASVAATVGFSSLLERTFKHRRCTNCHRYDATGSSYYQNVDGTKARHLSQGRYASNVNAKNPGTACRGCHIPSWRVPPSTQSFIGKSRQQLCNMAKTAPEGQTVEHHLKDDPRIIWAVTGNPSPRATPGGRAPYGGSSWNATVDAWINGGMSCD